ncbi:hypothetical protein [Phaeobacter gallaeciensis]|uniref:Acyl-CoA dehydrogenase n=1 Tax=Phaeobacter gallaeciensis TaxID=60890 RepID=A0AAC9Z9G4_9RHOB|nr:hypothetical protein [Phaeobacter gallaeciensis]AHD09790.1 hypothetical protein Gal_02040 [Phaeobacter gallaeciensis DSM 26640]ATE93054.1 hypothetical protein PhaeoP11_02031 [Phaeobacter gallaeciensis]ATE97124.1 hypothetical protein PhaeoP73_01815 [Phaeobacter gallaeciensis]ATF01719.1 hypothetical protein PhaeoP75_02081 [Phaeobacter gallaeciensis]ATF06099.1 hypothetical protein PhaeoP63_02030 [Phaeobacter gallaeciensis]
MFDLDPSNDLSSLTVAARRNAPKKALAELGRLLTGVPAYPALNGMALHATDHGADTGVAIIDLSRPSHKPCLTAPAQEDVGLQAFDLQLSSCDAGMLTDLGEMNRAFVALRLGWVLRCLDLAFGYLEGRESFGMQLLHQPLIKAQFSEINATVDRLLTENQLPGQTTAAMNRSTHREIGHLFGKAAKLMGGRGLLAGQCHGLELLDAVLFALIRPALAATADDLNGFGQG